MRIQPQSTVNLYSGIEIDNGEQIVFTSSLQQTNYFRSHIARQNTPCTTIKKTGALRLEVPGSIVSACNYISFVNPAFDNKTVYARIVDYDYINNECTEISYIIDYWQTWMFDVQFENMYIDRENISEGDHEKLEINPYDPTVLEMRTPEPLAVGRDLEKLTYSISWDPSNQDEDGFMLFNGDSDVPSIGTADIVDVIFFTAVNWEDLDTDSDTYQDSESDRISAFISSGSTSYSSFLEQYSKIKPSTAFKNFIKERNNVPYYKLANSTVWHTGEGTIYTNSTLATPYNTVVCWHSKSDTLIDYLTTWGLTSTIIGIFTMAKKTLDNALSGAYMSGTNVKTSEKMMQDGKAPNVTSHKLLSFPYSYLTLTNPDGETKELRYEWFEEALNGGSFVKLGSTIDMNAQPTLVVAPYKYKQVLPDNEDSKTFNLKEGMTYDAIPQVPFCTDGYLTALSEYSKKIIANNTVDYQYDIGSRWLNNRGGLASVGSNIINGVSKIDGLAGAVSALANVPEQAVALTSLQNSRLRLQNEANMSDDAYLALSGNDSFNAVTANFEHTKPAYAQAIYHSGTRNGILNYLYGITNQGIIVQHNRLNDEIMSQYDLYFKQYGYKSNRCGIPRVCNFIHGGMGTKFELPHWIELNGKEVTYVKTMDCKIVYSQWPVAQFIKQMFDNGVRFINGNKLPGAGGH